jgi:transposase
MARPKNGVRCPECDSIAEVLKTMPDVGSGKGRVYFCPQCGGIIHTHESVVRYTPPVAVG